MASQFSENMMPEAPRGMFAYWRQDSLASIVVFLVALPLCMGIALASGAPVSAGLITGIIGGLVVGTIAGSPLQVSGPAAGLTVICGEIIRQNGMPGLGLAVLLGGILQILAGTFHLGQWFRAVSPAVIHGMLSGIGILIISSQIHVLVDDLPRENAVKNIMAIPESLKKCIGPSVWENSDVRASRMELLNTLRSLANRQTGLQRNLDRAMIRVEAQQADLSASVGGNPVATSLSDPFAEFVAVETDIAAMYSQFLTQLRESPLSVSGANGALEQATKTESDLQSLIAAIKSSPKTSDALQQLNTQLLQVKKSLVETQAWLKSPNWASKLGVLVVLIIFLWQTFAKGKLKLIPAPLLGIVIATVIAQFLIVPIIYVDVPSSLLEGLTLPSWQSFQELSPRNIIIAGITIAVIASAETLLCATAVDQMHNGPRTRYDQELAAQGVGNSICGVLGVLPMTGVIVRSAANVQAGGKTRLSAIMHGGLLLLFTWALTPLLRMIPTAALAGILVYTGFRLVDFKGFRHLWHTNRAEAIIFLITVVVIIVEDLLIGVVTGIVLSALRLLITFSKLDIRSAVSTEAAGRQTVHLELEGAATFLRLPLLASRLEQVPPGATLHVDLDQLTFIDHACLELFINWEKQHQAGGGRLVMDWESLHATFAQKQAAS